MLNILNLPQQLRGHPPTLQHVLHLDLEVDKLINYYKMKHYV